MLVHLDLDAYRPLPEPYFSTISQLRELRTRAGAGDNEALIQAVQNESQPDELIRVYAAGMIVADRLDTDQVKILGRLLLTDSNVSVQVALAKKLRDVPASDAVPLKEIVSWLLKAIIHGRHVELRLIAAEVARAKHDRLDTPPQETWQSKVDVLFHLLAVSTYYREHLDITALVTAVTPPPEMPRSDRSDDIQPPLANACMSYAAVNQRNKRLAGILAALVVESCGHSLYRAGQCLTDYLRAHPNDADKLNLLREEINSLLMPPELLKTLAESYEQPLETLQKEVRSNWAKSVGSAQFGLYVRLIVGAVVSMGVAVAGVCLLVQGIQGLSDTAVWLPTVHIVLGLFLLLFPLVYRGPVRDFQQMMADIGTANTVYATFTQQRLHISHHHAALSLQNRLTMAELQESSQLLGNAMKEAVQTLRHERKPVTIDEFLKQME